jgi:fructoselysine-6-P-deglycase FrlB-like protein
VNGFQLIQYEMSRQHEDALASFNNAENLAKEIAASVKRTGKLCLLGMGGSHWVNRTVMFAYRELGIEVQAEVLSEALFRRLPKSPRTVLLVSQSGNSGEIGHYVKAEAEGEERFGMTLNTDSALATAVPSLIGAGGVEKAFAATRSIFVSHAMHLAILNALGSNVELALEAMQSGKSTTTNLAFEALSNCSTLIISGRSELQGVAESGALCLMELARMNTYALEGGQLRHGPLEMLSAHCGAIFLRADDNTSELTAALENDCRRAGVKTVVLDFSGKDPIQNCITITLPKSNGMAAVFTVLPILQSLLVEIANSKVENVGVPLRSTKVTTAL